MDPYWDCRHEAWYQSLCCVIRTKVKAIGLQIWWRPETCHTHTDRTFSTYSIRLGFHVMLVCWHLKLASIFTNACYRSFCERFIRVCISFFCLLVKTSDFSLVTFAVALQVHVYLPLLLRAAPTSQNPSNQQLMLRIKSPSYIFSFR